MALFPQSLTFITCLSKCRIGDVFKHSFFYFLYLFRMYEEGGGQMTCYWYVLISLKLFLIVCICRFAGMTWNCHIGYMIFYTYLGKNFYFSQCLGICGISWNQGGVFKRPFWRKNFSKSKPIFSTTQNGLARAQRWWW